MFYEYERLGDVVVKKIYISKYIKSRTDVFKLSNLNIPWKLNSSSLVRGFPYLPLLASFICVIRLSWDKKVLKPRYKIVTGKTLPHRHLCNCKGSICWQIESKIMSKATGKFDLRVPFDGAPSLFIFIITLLAILSNCGYRNHLIS